MTHTLRDKHIIVVGAGMGGLAAAIDLARMGCRVTVVEKEAGPGGKMRQVVAGGRGIDAGPTVFTMRWVFEGLFGDAGAALTDYMTLKPAGIMARHAWTDSSDLDLYADIDRSADAIRIFAGPRDARGYRAFCDRSAAMYATLRDTFIAAQRPSMLDLVARGGLSGLLPLLNTAPHATLWSELGRYFTDPRLRQLFGRYATYCGSSPFAAPATLMLVAHVEQEGVSLVEGGMVNVARALERLGASLGAAYRYGDGVQRLRMQGGRATGVMLASGEVVEGDAVVFNGDVSALATHLLDPSVPGAPAPVSQPNRSLSAVTWCATARTSGFDLAHHTVFFARHYAREFRAVFGDQDICAEPTVYVCAQDRHDGQAAVEGSERLLLLVNAPAVGDERSFSEDDIESVRERAWTVLERCGLRLDVEDAVATAPDGFESLFPASGGALYGRANHGPLASFDRPGAFSGVPGLYLAGGSVHPGPGIPMATLSGRLAAARVVADINGTKVGWRLPSLELA